MPNIVMTEAHQGIIAGLAGLLAVLCFTILLVHCEEMRNSKSLSSPVNQKENYLEDMNQLLVMKVIDILEMTIEKKIAVLEQAKDKMERKVDNFEKKELMDI